MDDNTSTNSSRPPLVIEQIKRQIRKRIGTMWRIGDRLPPINELARDMGVGEKNTYRAVRELAEEGILASRPRHGTFVTDRPHKQRARAQKRHRIRIMLGPDCDGMIQRMGHAFHDEARRRNLNVEFDNHYSTRTRELDLRGIDADAVVLINAGDRQILTDETGPVFSIMDTSSRSPRGVTQRYDLVGPDNEQGGLLAGQLFEQFDITEVGFVGVGDPETGTYYRELDKARLAGFERGFGQEVPLHHRFFVDSYSDQSGAIFARQYAEMKSRPQAMFTASDDIAAGFIIGGVALNLKQREDYFLIGFDGQARGSNVVYGGLTTVAVPAEAMGRQAAEFLEMRLEHPDLPPRSISLGCTIKRGKTTPRATKPHHPFNDPDATYWPTTPGPGDSS